MKAVQSRKKHGGVRGRGVSSMQQSHLPREDREVAEFVRRHRLERSVLVTHKLMRDSFRDELSEVVSTVVDDVDESDEVDQALVVQIGFRGHRKRFHERFKAFIKQWVRVVGPGHQKLIQFRFHIRNE